MVPTFTYFSTRCFFQNTAHISFPSNRYIWLPKKGEFYAPSKSEDEIEKKCTNEMLFKKPSKKLLMTSN
jgi:hypothetical protein